MSYGAEERMLSNTAPAIPSSSGADYTFGAIFTVTADGQITHIRYWNAETGGNTHRLSIWSRSDQVKRASVVDGPTTTSGWREVALATPLAVTAGVDYVVGFSNENLVWGSTTGTPTSLAPHLTGYAGCYSLTGDTYPGTSSPNQYHVDVVYRPTIADTGVAGQWWPRGNWS